MAKDKTQGFPQDRSPMAFAGPPQPLLPSVNLAQCLTDSTWCECLCRGCPPWEHPKSFCAGVCLDQCDANKAVYPHY